MTSHQNVRLGRGAHQSPDDGACVMELVSMLAGEPFRDRPDTACPVIGAFLRAYNDLTGISRRQDLLACAAAVVGSRRPQSEGERVQRCALLAIECYHNLPWWRHGAADDDGLIVVLDIADGHGDRNVDLLGYHVARLVHRSRGGHACVVGFVEQLAALGAAPPRRRATEPRVAIRG